MEPAGWHGAQRHWKRVTHLRLGLPRSCDKVQADASPVLLPHVRRDFWCPSPPTKNSNRRATGVQMSDSQCPELVLVSQFKEATGQVRAKVNGCG